MELGLSLVQVSLGWGLKFRKREMEELMFLLNSVGLQD